MYEVAPIDKFRPSNSQYCKFPYQALPQPVVDTRIQQIGQQLQSWVAPYFKPIAYSLILLRGQGYPCVFWGDLYGCAGKNPQQAVSSLSTFIKARHLFSYGETRDYWDHPSCVGWVRVGDDFHDGCAVVLSIGDEGCVPPPSRPESLPTNVA